MRGIIQGRANGTMGGGGRTVPRELSWKLELARQWVGRTGAGEEGPSLPVESNCVQGSKAWERAWYWEEERGARVRTSE